MLALKQTTFTRLEPVPIGNIVLYGSGGERLPGLVAQFPQQPSLKVVLLFGSKNFQGKSSIQCVEGNTNIVVVDLGLPEIRADLEWLQRMDAPDGLRDGMLIAHQEGLGVVALAPNEAMPRFWSNWGKSDLTTSTEVHCPLDLGVRDANSNFIQLYENKG